MRTTAPSAVRRAGPSGPGRPDPRGHARGALIAALVLWTGAACGEATRPGRVGDPCAGAGDCESGLCYASECLAPEADTDGDGLINRVEHALGSNPNDADSDGDGAPDADEIGSITAPRDTDSDGRPDLVESGTADGADQDCITSQFDAQDDVANTDLSPMIAKVCSHAGLCAEHTARLRAACPDGRSAVCLYDDVPGYATPEAACDGRDENCDGHVDEGFPRGCAEPFVVPARGGRTVATERFRATLVLGHPALAERATPRYRALLGTDPILAPQPTPSATPEVP